MPTWARIIEYCCSLWYLSYIYKAPKINYTWAFFSELTYEYWSLPAGQFLHAGELSELLTNVPVGHGRSRYRPLIASAKPLRRNTLRNSCSAIQSIPANRISIDSFIFLWAPLKWNFKKKKIIYNNNQGGNPQDWILSI